MGAPGLDKHRHDDAGGTESQRRNVAISRRALTSKHRIERPENGADRHDEPTTLATTGGRNEGFDCDSNSRLRAERERQRGIRRNAALKASKSTANRAKQSRNSRTR